MDEAALQRDSRDYAMLLEVCKRRRTQLAKKLRLDQTEQQRRMEALRLSEESVRQSLSRTARHAEELLAHTGAGRLIGLPELQARRDHQLRLNAQLLQTRMQCSQAARAVTEAASACKCALEAYSSNESTMHALVTSLARCNKALNAAKELRDDDEVTDLRQQRLQVR